MKYLAALIVASLLCSRVSAEPLVAKRVEYELGAALGFQIFRYEAPPGDDVVIIIRQRTEHQGKIHEIEHALVGNHMGMNFQIILMDSGAFDSRRKNAYVLRYPQMEVAIENEQLTYSGNTDDGLVELVFSRPGTNEPQRRITWKASLEKYSDVLKQWPGLGKPAAKSMFNTSRVVRMQ